MPLTISTGTKSYPVKTPAILLYALLLGGGYIRKKINFAKNARGWK